MPSGAAKRRKASKKKMKTGEPHNPNTSSSNSSSTHSQGGDDVRSIDDRESDSGEYEREEEEEKRAESHENIQVERKESLVERKESQENIQVERKESENLIEDVLQSTTANQTADGIEEQQTIQIENGFDEREEQKSSPKNEDRKVDEREEQKSPQNGFSDSGKDSNTVVEQVHNLWEKHIPVLDSEKETVDSLLPNEDEKLSPAAVVEKKIEVVPLENGTSDKPDKLPDSFDSLVPVNGMLPDMKDSEEKVISDDVKNGETVKHMDDAAQLVSTSRGMDNHNQPLMASTPIPVQRTSMMGCCGLFELFSRSR